MNDFLDNLANDQYRKMHKEEPTEFDKITPETYEEMNKEFEEEGTMVRLVVPTQEDLDKWKEWTDPDMHKRTVPPTDMVAEMWEKHNEREIEINFGSEYESGINYYNEV